MLTRVNGEEKLVQNIPQGAMVVVTRSNGLLLYGKFLGTFNHGIGKLNIGIEVQLADGQTRYYQHLRDEPVFLLSGEQQKAYDDLMKG